MPNSLLLGAFSQPQAATNYPKAASRHRPRAGFHLARSIGQSRFLRLARLRRVIPQGVIMRSAPSLLGRCWLADWDARMQARPQQRKLRSLQGIPAPYRSGRPQPPIQQGLSAEVQRQGPQQQIATVQVDRFQPCLRSPDDGRPYLIRHLQLAGRGLETNGRLQPESRVF